MRSKKGLSDVVTTLIIILLALAAIVIVWAVVSSLVKDTANQTDLSSKCLGLSVDIDSTDASEISGVRVSAGKADGTKNIGNYSGNIEPLQTVSTTVTGLTFSTGNKIEVDSVIVIKSDDGTDEFICSQKSSAEITAQ